MRTQPHLNLNLAFMLYEIIAVVVALILLVVSADLLVKYASTLANTLGVTPFLIGVVIIGFGTSAPEMFVSVLASLEDKGNLAIGNALGSNIANIGLVLGVAGIFGKIIMDKRIVFIEMPIVFGFTALAAVLLFDGVLSLIDGIIMFTVLVAYLIWSATQNKSDAEEIEIDESASTAKSSLFTLLSLALLIGSSKLLVWGAVGIATRYGVSELVIGLTVVAIGTSLPELAASIAAVRQKAGSMVIGNIIGSNSFNILGVLGLTGMVKQTNVDPVTFQRDFPVLFLLMFVLWLFVLRKKLLSTWQAVLLLVAYMAYIINLAMKAL